MSIQSFNRIFFFSPVSYIQAGGGWLRDARTVRSRGQILHRVPSPAERCSDHPGELPQPDHTGNHPSPGSHCTVFQQWMVGQDLSILCRLLILSAFVPLSEWQHNRAPAEGRLCPLRGLVHGCLHAGSRETPSCRTVSSCRHAETSWSAVVYLTEEF